MWHGSTSEGAASHSDCLSWSSSSYTASGSATLFTDTRTNSNDNSNNILLEQIDVRCDRPLAVLCVLSSPVVWRLLYSLFIIMLSQELVLTKLYRIIFLDYGLSNVLTESCITIIIMSFESQQSAILHVLLCCCGVIVWYLYSVALFFHFHV